MAESIRWQLDILGEGFRSALIDLPPLHGNPQRCAITKYIPELDPRPRSINKPTEENSHITATRPQKEFILITVHGWNDYFYHREFARFIGAIGGHLYALDLRRYGRAHKDDEPWGYTDSLSIYDAEIQAALEIARFEHPHLPVFVYGHSTGGLLSLIHI